MDTKKEIPDKAQWVYASPDLKELSQRYDQWAGEYDKDMVEVFGSVGPKKTVDIFTKHVSTDAKVLDVGAGTGLVGEILYSKGYKDISALDISWQMLEEARKKKVYSELSQGILGETLDLPTDNYQAIMAKGVFAPNHAPSSAFDELIRITQKGGIIVFTLRADYYENSDFPDKQKSLETAKQWKLIEKTEPFAMWPKATEKLVYNVWVYEVTKNG